MEFTEIEIRFMAGMLSNYADVMEKDDPARKTVVSLMRKLDNAVQGCLVAYGRGGYGEVRAWLDKQPADKKEPDPRHTGVLIPPPSKETLRKRTQEMEEGFIGD